MSTCTADVVETGASALARECLYRFFAAVLSDPRGPGWGAIADPDDRLLAAAAAAILREDAEAEPVPLGYGERPPADLDLYDLLGELRRPQEDLAAEYDRTFGLVSLRECPPYGTEYGPNSEPFFRAQQLADVAGFYAAFGVMGGRTRPERADHVALELEFLAHLLLKQRLAGDSDEGRARAAVCADAARRFFRDHVVPWGPAFTAGLQRRGGLYAQVGRALAAFLPTERSRFGIPIPKAPMRPLPSVRPEEESQGCAGCAAGA
jgi:TorA maturation chaperone TorD